MRVRHRATGRLGTVTDYDGAMLMHSIWVRWDNGYSNYYLTSELESME